MIFKKTYRKIYLSENSTLQELCDKINKNIHSNLYSTLSNDRIIVSKKYFSDFFPFNFAHLGSLMIHAKSEKMEDESEQIEFIIEMNDFTKFSTYGSLILLAGITFEAILSLQFNLVIVSVISTVIALMWTRFFYNYGIANFTKNWDNFIGHKI